VRALLRYRTHALRPYVILALVGLAFALLPVFDSSATVSSQNIYNVLQILSGVGIVTLALGLTMIAGEFDLAVSSTFLLGGMIAVLTGVDWPAGGVLLAVTVGAGVGFIQGFTIAKLRMESMALTLGVFIALLGVVFVISDSQSKSYANSGVGERLDAHVLSIFSVRILIGIALFAVIGLVLAGTVLGRDLRAVGSDRKASRTSGVRVDWVIVGVFVLSGFLATFAGSLQSYSLAYATPDRTVAPLIFATTAALLGGVPLSGGRGDPFGIAAGVLTLALIGEGLVVLATPEYVKYLVTGSLLLLVVLMDAPDLFRWWKTLQADRLTRATAGSPPTPSPPPAHPD
jgi:ribose/xylose/arabinose/galactoside ABC-type transport system permease subunit